ncbi:MAG: class I SAM-dependent methyltransferase [Fibrobacterales bacterium]
MTQEHWNTIFSNTSQEQLGWFESEVSQTFSLLDRIPNLKEKHVFVAGVGTSILAESLIGKTAVLTLNDLSDKALTLLKQRLPENTQPIEWVAGDISTRLSIDLESIDVWVDRAVLHFLTEERDIDAYFAQLRQSLHHKGYVLIAEFSDTGAPKCAGLEVHRYTEDEISHRLGSQFTLIHAESYTFTNPNGDARPYIYTLYQKG